MRTSIAWIAAGLLGLVWATSAIAQESPKPGPEHERLKQLEGTWDAVMTFGEMKSKATAVYKSICGGMWLESEYRGEVFGQKYEGRGLDGYDLRKKKYVGVFVQSMESAPMHMEGTYDEKTKTTTMTGESVGQDGKPEKFKTTTVHPDKDHFTFKMFMVGADGKENLAFTIEYTRKK